MLYIRSLTLYLVLTAGLFAHASKSSCEPDLASGNAAYQMVQLRNDARVPSVMAAVITLGLQTLLKTSPDCFPELVRRARNPEHQFTPAAIKTLTAAGLVDEHGHMADEVREIVLSAATGDENDPKFVSPVAARTLVGEELDHHFKRLGQLTDHIAGVAADHGVTLRPVQEDPRAEAGHVVPNGAVALEFTADGLPLRFWTPLGHLNAFAPAEADEANRQALFETLSGRLGLRPIEGQPSLFALTKDEQGAVLPEPELRKKINLASGEPENTGGRTAD